MKHIETDKDEEEEEEEENDEKPAVSAMSSSTDGGGGWGASTYFLDPPTGEMVEVQPAPGRVVIMDQDVTHTVSAPSREAGGRPRATPSSGSSPSSPPRRRRPRCRRRRCHRERRKGARRLLERTQREADSSLPRRILYEEE